MPLNCWQVKKCGREPGGEHLAELGVCPAAAKTRCDGANRGNNAGRVCWLVSGTLCGGEVGGHFAQKLASCSDCDFYKQVYQEEGACVSESEVLASLTDPAQIAHAYEELRSMSAKLKEMQAHLVQLRKLEAIGQLAAGIAHEINTPTQFIGDNLSFLKDAFGPVLQAVQASFQMLNATKATAELIPKLDPAFGADEIADLVREIPQAIEQSLGGVSRVASIVRALREFSHPGSREKVPLDVHRTIENAVMIARGEWRDVAEVRMEFDPAALPVFCVPDEFNEVILNLVVNAAQAIRSLGNRSRCGGTIAIRTRQLGNRVEVQISDNGPGIPQAIQHRIFEPFFTTKGVGEGTGQGLYLAYSCIVKKYGGTLSFECPPGRGTTFTIRIPCS